MGNLKLITTERFGDIACDFYRNMNDDILLTREQIGSALEYTDPGKAIRKIHLKHKDRLEPLCLRVKLTGQPQSGATLTNGEKQERVYYTERGIMELCRWSTKPKANQFMDWCWDIVEKYRNNQGFTDQNIQTLINAITTLTSTLTTMQKDISDIKEHQKQTTKKSFSHWASKMFPKYQLLMDYFDIDCKELYHNLFLELQNLYPDIDLAQMQDDYCIENKLDNCFTMDVIEHNKELRILFEQMVDELLVRYNLIYCGDERSYRKTIFI